MSDSPLIAKRPEPRRSTWVSANIAIGDWQSEARIRNVSRLGALLEGANAPCVDAAITIGCADFSRPAKVVWRDQERFGIAFDQPLLPPQLRALAADGLRVATPAAYRLIEAPPPSLRAVGD